MGRLLPELMGSESRSPGALIDYPVPGGHPNFSIINKLLNLHPRIPWPPKTAHEDQRVKVRVSISPRNHFHGRSSPGHGRSSPGTVYPQA